MQVIERLEARHERWLSRLYSEDPGGCRRQLARFFPTADARLIAEAAERVHWDAVRAQIGRLRRAGARVLCVTAKDKLRLLLAHGDVPATSAEKAHEHPLPAYGIDDVVALVGRKNPGPYEWDMSHYAMEIGLAVTRAAGHLDLLYVSLTDFANSSPGHSYSIA